jgi:hypothetical protein
MNTVALKVKVYGSPPCWLSSVTYLPSIYKTQKVWKSYNLTGLLSTFRTCELNESIATRLIAILDTDSGAHDWSKLLESFVQVFVRPVNSEAFHKNVASRFTASEELLVVGKSSTNFSMKFRELDVVEQSTSLDNVGKAAKSVVEILESRSKMFRFKNFTF